MPYKYAVECVCDKLAATKTYAGKNYTTDMPLAHFRKYGNKVKTNPKVIEFIDKVFCDVKDLGESTVLNKKYMKKLYNAICNS